MSTAALTAPGAAAASAIICNKSNLMLNVRRRGRLAKTLMQICLSPESKMKNCWSAVDIWIEGENKAKLCLDYFMRLWGLEGGWEEKIFSLSDKERKWGFDMELCCSTTPRDISSSCCNTKHAHNEPCCLWSILNISLPSHNPEQHSHCASARCRRQTWKSTSSRVIAKDFHSCNWICYLVMWKELK